MHRPRIDWEKAELRYKNGTVQQMIFEGLQKMISVRKTIPAFADYNNRELLDTNNQHLFVLMRNHPFQLNDNVLVVGNFSDTPQPLILSELSNRGRFGLGRLQDLYSGESLAADKDRVIVPPFRFYWLTDRSS
jgi:amylosucrase